MKIKIKIILFILVFPLFSSSAFAHGIERVIPTMDLGGFAFSFAADPQFPVIGRETHMEFAFADGLPSTFAVVIDGETLSPNREETGYDLHYTFVKSGDYPLSFILNEEVFSSDISLQVFSLGLAGWWRIIFLGIAILLLLLGIFAERKHITNIKNKI